MMGLPCYYLEANLCARVQILLEEQVRLTTFGVSSGCDLTRRKDHHVVYSIR